MRSSTVCGSYTLGSMRKQRITFRRDVPWDVSCRPYTLPPKFRINLPMGITIQCRSHIRNHCRKPSQGKPSTLTTLFRFCIVRLSPIRRGRKKESSALMPLCTTMHKVDKGQILLTYIYTHFLFCFSHHCLPGCLSFLFMTGNKTILPIF